MVTCTNRLTLFLFVYFISSSYVIAYTNALNITISKILTEILIHLKPFLYIFENIDNLYSNVISNKNLLTYATMIAKSTCDV